MNKFKLILFRMDGWMNEGAMEMTKSKYSASPPSSRLPPDGHEFPSSNYEELMYGCDAGAASGGRKPLLAGSRCGVAGSWRSSNGRSDERSESSVKDKIALFTKEDKKPVNLLENCSSLRIDGWVCAITVTIGLGCCRNWGGSATDGASKPFLLGG